MDTDARKRQIMIWYSIAALIGILLVQYLWASYTQVETIPYSTFERLLNDGKIAEVSVGAEAIEGALKAPLPSGKRAFYTVRVDPQLADKLSAHDVVIKGAPSGGWVVTILSWIVPATLAMLHEFRGSLERAALA